MSKLTMNVGKLGLSVKENDSGKLIFHTQVHTTHQQEFENSLKKLFELLCRVSNTEKIIFYFDEFLEISDIFKDYFSKLGVSIEKKKKPQNFIKNQQLWLMRHGYYQIGAGQLSEEGIDRVKKASAVFKDKKITIYHSPVTRCVETATILKESLIGAELHQIHWLGDFAELPEDWLSHLQGETVVVVSHQPVLCTLAQQLIENFEFFNFTCGWPVAVVSTPQGNHLQPFAGNL
ncbi:MAG: hypothetical protein QG599_2914 [Pseudomonadota bacterium]|nr:hypothetical protein [Pseudomonadota bacterium]